MSNVRKPSASSSSRLPADVTVTGKKTGTGLPDHGSVVKRFRPDADQAVMAVVPPSDTPVSLITITSLPSTGFLPGRPEAGTLEHYRLRAPAGLPAANSAGLRVFKGRTYVDVAPGEIVQVQPGAAPGEYRAMLMSERMASGPSLFLDPQSGTWTSERPPSLATGGNVIDIDVDAVIREVRNGQAADGRVHTGRGDVFEHETLLNHSQVVRGLKQFPPEQAAIIRSELQVIESVFGDATLAMRLEYVGVEAVYESFFGSAHRNVASRFIDSVERGLALSREYQGVWGEEKIFGADTANTTAAWMYKTDFHGRLFLNRGFLQPEMLSMSLGHEMLHTSRIDRFKSVGPGAEDFFYLDDRRRNLLGLPPRALYDIPERSVSEVIMRGGLTVDYLNAFTDDHDSFLLGISAYLGIGVGLELRTAVDLFNLNALLRAHLAANNADSLVFAAKSLQVLHRSQLEPRS